MTNDDQKQNALAWIASLDGKPIQAKWQGDGEWEDYLDPSPDQINWNGVDLFRPSPEPVTAPWSMPEHVPGPVCWIRNKGNGFVELIVEIASDGIRAGSNDDLGTWEDMKRWDYSTDRVNWFPCTVTQ